MNDTSASTSYSDFVDSRHAPEAPRAEEAQARTFPCEGCGASLTFDIGAQSLKCPYCGHVKAIALDDSAVVAEQDLNAMIARIAELRATGAADEAGLSEVRCASCGAVVTFAGTLTSTGCPYCGDPLQREDIHGAEHGVPVDGVLPFAVSRESAGANLRQWVSSRWFAPNDFKQRGVQGRFSGVYLPYWTFDSMTFTRYTGQRGEHYYVTTGSGKNQRRERRTRWYPACGSFQRFFDDVLIVAGIGLPKKLLYALEPWPLERCRPFNPELLAGFLARTYDVELEDGLVVARSRMDQELETDVRRRIGGDEQQIHSIDTRYDALTYKHLLLPVWMLGYKYRDKSYRVVVNAGTGEVQGDRPYSWIKILLAVLAGLAFAAGIALIATYAQS